MSPITHVALPTWLPKLYFLAFDTFGVMQGGVGGEKFVGNSLIVVDMLKRVPSFVEGGRSTYITSEAGKRWVAIVFEVIILRRQRRPRDELNRIYRTPVFIDGSASARHICPG